MKKKPFLLFASILLVAALTACQSPQKEETTPKKTNAAQKDNNDVSPNTSGNTNASNGTGAANNNKQEASNGAANEPGELPEYLPEDFPMPENAEITMARTDIDEGRKSVFLTFKVKAEMADMAKMYTDYFATRKLDDAAQTIDKTNLIIQGGSSEYQESWSMIGGLNSEGLVDITLNWWEL